MMNFLKKTVLFGALLLWDSNVFAQNWTWAALAQSEEDDAGYCCAEDGQGNLYVAGSFDGASLSFGNVTLSNPQKKYKGYIAKYDCLGNTVWARAIGNDESDCECISITCDVYGNIYATGYINGGVHVIYYPNLPPFLYWASSIFIAKYDSWGQPLWLKEAGNGNDFGVAVTTDPDGNVYVAGNWFDDSLHFGNITLLYEGYSDLFLVKFDKGGNAVWGKAFGGGAWDDGCNALSADKDNNVYVTGNFQSSTIRIDDKVLTNYDAGNYNLSYPDLFLAKFGRDGECIWAKSAGGAYDESSNGIATDDHCNVFITGSFSSALIAFDSITLVNTADQSGYSYNYFMTKYDSSGSVIFARNAKGQMAAGNVCVDSKNNVYTTGSYYESGCSFNTFLLSGNKGIFVNKYDNLGILIWANSAEGDGYNYGNGIIADTSCVRIVGTFTGETLSFGSISLQGLASGTQGFHDGDIYIAQIDSPKCLIPEFIGDSFVYPNPNDGHFNLATRNFSTGSAISIFNRIGQEIYRNNLLNEIQVIDLSQIPNGVYFLRLYNENRSSCSKFIIQK